MNKAKIQDKNRISKKYQIIGVSKYVRSLRDKIKEASDNDDHVLITGPTGTGKELVARNIHWNINRSEQKFVPVNCGAIAPNLFESELFGIELGVATGVTKRDGYIKYAEGGTLFLDEIGDLSIENQAKLLRFLDDKTFMTVGGRREITAKIKIVAATNKNLELEIQNGKFRADLFYRLAQQTITTEPLAGKIGDTICLVNHFMNIKDTINVKVKMLLYLYGFPGNVRELQALVGKDLDEIIDIVERWSEEPGNKNAPAIKSLLKDAIEIFTEGITIIGPNCGVDPERDDYVDWFGDLSKYGFSDEERMTLEILMKDKGTEAISELIKRYEADDKYMLGNMLLEKRHSAIIKRDDDIIDKRLMFYEVAILAQDCNCSKDEIRNLLHIRSEKLSPDEFRETYHFDYPDKKLYEVKFPMDVFPEPYTLEDANE